MSGSGRQCLEGLSDVEKTSIGGARINKRITDAGLDILSHVFTIIINNCCAYRLSIFSGYKS